MADRSAIGSWLSGPQPPEDGGYPGRRLGRPETGPGSIARPGRRLAAIFVDWMLALLISTAFFDGDAWATLLIFGAEQAVLVGTAGFAVGHRLLGLRVERLGGGLPGPVAGLVRSTLLCLAIPALIWDRDQRGLHDRAARTLIARR